MSIDIKQIIKMRYQKFVIIGMLLLGLFYLVNINSEFRQWKSISEYYHSETFQADYEENVEHFVYYPEDGTVAIPYKNINEYIRANTYLYGDANGGQDPNLLSNKEIKSDAIYPNTFFMENSWVFMVIFFLLGFLLFFVDLKTNFNTFLFSLGVTRRQIFLEKLKVVAVPLLGTLLLAKLAFIASIYLLIPFELINVQLSTLLLTALNSWLITFLYFTFGLFIGAAVGNLIFALVIVVSFFVSSMYIPSSLTNYLYAINFYKTQDFERNYYRYLDFSIEIGKSPVNLWVCLAMFLVSLLLVFISWSIFKQTSLEKSNQNLLIDKSRLPITILVIVYSCFIFWGEAFTYALTIVPYKSIDTVYFISRCLISGVLIAVVTIGVIYMAPLKKRLLRFVRRAVR
ncbi:hypothetical protein IGI37_002307 [Enterococcus sp. AZ194]|uniref:hypothetical protein n=1 Tax=Enterococcus sp. AZ194 TaxID=2774629 RepID=UPI003F27E9F2